MKVRLVGFRSICGLGTSGAEMVRKMKLRSGSLDEERWAQTTGGKSQSNWTLAFDNSEDVLTAQRQDLWHAYPLALSVYQTSLEMLRLSDFSYVVL